MRCLIGLVVLLLVACTSEPTPKPPDVLLVVMDTVRAVSSHSS